MPLGREVGFGTSDIVLHGDPASHPPKGGRAPNLWPISVEIPLGREVGLSPSDIVLNGDPAPLPSPKRGRSPQFSAHICCGQMAEWIKMSLGREVGLSSGHIVLDGDLAPFPPPRGAHSFWTMSIVVTVAHLSYC